MGMNLMPYGVLTVMFKHWRAALGVFLAVMLAGTGYLLFDEPKYESVAKLIVRFGDRSIPDVNRGRQSELTPSDRREIVLANSDILESHDLAQATINAFGLDRVYPDIVNDPPTRWAPMDEAVKTFGKNLWVDVGTQDNVITVSLLHPDKALVPKLVQKLIDLYIQNETQVYQNPQATFLAHEVKLAGQRLAKAQAALEQFKGRWHITDYDQEIQALLKTRGDVDINLRNAEASYEQSKHRKRDIEGLIRNVPTNQPEPANGEQYRSLDDAQGKLADLKAKQAEMLATYAPHSRAMATIDAGVATAEREVTMLRRESKRRSIASPNVVHQTLQTDLLRTSADAKAQAEPVRVLTDQMKQIRERLQDLQANRGQFDNLNRERQIAEDTYKTLSTQFEDARVKDNLNQRAISPAAIISEPTLPYKPAWPRPLL
ncbi:MAG: GumC family protein, partial [Stellaceae bacterium]